MLLWMRVQQPEAFELAAAYLQIKVKLTPNTNNKGSSI